MNSVPTHRAILITGGGGFIGSHLAERLVERGERVVVVDNFTTGRRRNLAAVASHPNLEVIEADCSDAIQSLRPAEFSAVYHLAAAVGVRLVVDEPVRTIETNIHETSAMLDFAAEARVPFLLASTSEVYGKSEKLPFREDDDVVYGPTTLHRWSYACSKAIDEYLALAHARQHGLPVVIARLFNTVGPRQLGDYGMVLPRFVRAAMANEPLEVYGDGRQTRCFCDVRDVVDVLIRMIELDACHGKVFNVGNDELVSIHDLAQRVVRTLKSGSEIRLVPYDVVFGPGFDDLRDRQPDLARLRQATGFSPRVGLESTIRDLAAWIASEAESADVSKA